MTWSHNLTYLTSPQSSSLEVPNLPHLTSTLYESEVSEVGEAKNTTGHLHVQSLPPAETSPPLATPSTWNAP
jgi:hypothetical protein